MSVKQYPLKATSNVLNLLGNELIGSDSLAIFELVKNAYDADAEHVKISFKDLNTPSPSITIEDDGHGMSLEVIHKVWLTIGTDYKRREAKISPRFHRSSLGNKGVGRLAVHRLANNIFLETKTEMDMFGCNLSINWQQLVQSGQYINDLQVDVVDGIRTPFFKNHGTRIILSDLKTKVWTKPMLRDLARKIENIKNPFHELEDASIFGNIDNFDVTIECDPDKQDWINGIKTSTEILQNSLYYFHFTIAPRLNDRQEEDSDAPAQFIWRYLFRPQSFQKCADRQTDNINSPKAAQVLPINPKDFGEFDVCMSEQLHLRNKDLAGIGKIVGSFYVFNQRPAILTHIYGAGRNNAIKTYIKDNCGVKVFRDNIRVYNYGEPFDDWLGMERRKVQRAADHFSQKVTIGAVALSLKDSEMGLLEKTNREGFSENITYFKFREIIQTIFQYFEREAMPDKKRIEELLNQITLTKNVGLSETIAELEIKLKEKGLEKELYPYIRRVEKDYNEMRDVMLNSGMTGLNMGLIFHEIEREMRYIALGLSESEIDVFALKERIKNLMILLDDFSPILKQNSKVKIDSTLLINRSLQINERRFAFHQIKIKVNTDQTFPIYGPSNLLLSSLSNLIDNAIYWVSNKKDLDPHYEPSIYISVDSTTLNAPSIIVVDNGNGFTLEPDSMIQPFYTTKPGGMGLGLYFVNLVMESIGGKILFPDNKDLNLPVGYDGACIVLVFPKNV